MRLFPTAGSFIFWLIWPYLVSRITSRAYFAHSGKVMSKTQAKNLRRNLATITRSIMKPVSPEKEKHMSKNATSKNVAIAGAAGGAAAIITMVAICAAFRVPKDLRKYIPSKKM